MFFKVLVGIHVEAEVTYHQGEIIETDNNLVLMFGASKFERVDEAAPVSKLAKVSKEEVEATAEEGAKELEPSLADCTADFEKAPEAGVKVLKVRKGYNVVDPDEPDKTLNDKPLSKVKTAEYIASLLK